VKTTCHAFAYRSEKHVVPNHPSSCTRCVPESARSCSSVRDGFPWRSGTILHGLLLQLPGVCQFADPLGFSVNLSAALGPAFTQNFHVHSPRRSRAGRPSLMISEVGNFFLISAMSAAKGKT
jgi:hypothetical protein